MWQSINVRLVFMIWYPLWPTTAYALHTFPWQLDQESENLDTHSSDPIINCCIGQSSMVLERWCKGSACRNAEVKVRLALQVNRVAFSVPAFRVKDGELILKAAYQVKSEERVSITLSEARLVRHPTQKWVGIGMTAFALSYLLCIGLNVCYNQCAIYYTHSYPIFTKMYSSLLLAPSQIHPRHWITGSLAIIVMAISWNALKINLILWMQQISSLPQLLIHEMGQHVTF